MTERGSLRAFAFDWAPESQSAALEGLLTSRVLHLKVLCPHRTAILDLTEILQTAVLRGGVQRGIAHFQLTDRAASLFVGFPSADMEEEYLDFLSDRSPEPTSWRHRLAAEDHLRRFQTCSGFLPSLAGVGLSLQVEESTLVLGENQRIFLGEFAGGNQRSIRVLLIGV